MKLSSKTIATFKNNLQSIFPHWFPARSRVGWKPSRRGFEEGSAPLEGDSELGLATV